ncbi:peptide/nickel transport system permease protein [Paucimonas lemoignei]|uniref:Peptide/nickel transport system permease protein n=1 Tax=Paucimonas lemoignei TaxID=29443 RepID=A0A4R3HV64_PAULE|nr:ABC transporter permease [Paucimonas lemoignei]TCS36644.1 peptide/nickel transport system permease protein [Paucimonas lemoignei]
MIAFVLRRLMQSLIVLLAMSLLVFAGVHAIGNPVDVLISPDASQAERAQIIAAFGLDQPLWHQYILFLKNAAQGDMGTSYVYSTPAFGLILERLPATMELAVAAILIAIVFGIPLGLWAGLKLDSVIGKAIMAASILGISLPTFWVGLMLIMFFAVQLGWLPAGGRGPTTLIFGVPVSFLSLEGLRHLMLPALNLALANVALITRLARAGTLDAMQQEYVKFARAKGLSSARIVGVHVLKNILIPIVTVLALQFGAIIAFSIVTETVFAWPGMGKLIIDSIRVLDRPVIVAYMILVATLFVLINLAADLVYSLLDPRVRLAGGTAQ